LNYYQQHFPEQTKKKAGYRSGFCALSKSKEKETSRINKLKNIN
jgi:hypothetical protein